MSTWSDTSGAAASDDSDVMPQFSEFWTTRQLLRYCCNKWSYNLSDIDKNPISQ
ncbi:hypothetical protein HPB52_003579 [Rhipicephalus sanguineus]|uniref:Uncharacterized protein n=1 Tax=Rhipicephalus sanguineus TaxID=34632 RepID=A0A9D4T6S8_RHISA|nr:hypothetical protein HPB52_003579 [Rhipicephalus sanguineus]